MKSTTNNIIFGMGAVILVLGGLFLLKKPASVSESQRNHSSQGTPAASYSTSLVVGEESFNFGTISMARGKVSHTFKIKNSTEKPVVLSKLYTSCMCTTAVLKRGDRQIGPYGMPGHGAIPKINEELAPNEEAEVEVTFDPAAHGPAGIGKISRVVYLENNAGKPLELKFSALVTP